MRFSQARIYSCLSTTTRQTTMYTVVENEKSTLLHKRQARARLKVREQPPLEVSIYNYLINLTLNSL